MTDALDEALIEAFRVYWELPPAARAAIPDDREFMARCARASLSAEQLAALRVPAPAG